MIDPTLDLMAEAQSSVPVATPSSDSGPTEIAPSATGAAPAKLFGTWMRLGDGTWGARIENTEPKQGQLVTLTRTNGKRSTHRVVDVRPMGNAWKAKIQDPELPYTETVTRAAPSERQQIPVVTSSALGSGLPQVAAPMTFVPKAPRDIKPLREPVAFRSHGGKVGALNQQNLVAGAAAAGHGILTGFSGRGAMTHSSLLATLLAGGFPADWAPTEKSAHAQAGRVLNALNQAGYVCRADTKRRNKRDVENKEEQELAALIAHDAKIDAGLDESKHYAADVAMDRAGGASEVLVDDKGAPTWAARWVVALGKNRSSELGSEFGHVVMIATLGQDDQLWLESEDEALARRVREDFQARVKSAEYAAADVTAWIKSVLVNKFRAAQLGGNWYCRKKYAADAERFLTTFSRVWGENWMLPALPIATSEQLRVGLVNSLIDEANVSLADYRKQLADAQAQAEADGEAFEGRIGKRAAMSLYERILSLCDRAASFGHLLGESYVVRLRATLTDIAEEISTSCNGAASGAEFASEFDRAMVETEVEDEEGGCSIA